MTVHRTIEQAVFWWDRGVLRETGGSPGYQVATDWHRYAQRLCYDYGSPLDGFVFPLALFAQPFDATTVAVVQVTAPGADRLGFRLLLVPRRLYVSSIRDPFAVSDRFPPTWNVEGLYPALTWPDEPPRYRRIDELQRTLQTGNSPLLLGAVQALVDGGRLAFRQTQPNETLIRNLWQLLPEFARAELWPATFAFSNRLRFDVLITPHTDSPEFERYLTEDEVLDYPEGAYEFSLQYAIEHSDQSEVDRLFGRRSSKQYLRFVIGLLLAAMGVAIGIHYVLAD